MREMLLNHSPPIFKPVRTFVFGEINAKVTRVLFFSSSLKLWHA